MAEKLCEPGDAGVMRLDVDFGHRLGMYTLVLTWEQAEEILTAIVAFDKIKLVAEDFSAWIAGVMSAGGPLALKLLCQNAQKMLGPWPMVVTLGALTVDLEWEDVLAILQRVDSIDKVKEMLVNFQGSIETLFAVAGPVARKLLLPMLRKEFQHLKAKVRTCPAHLL